MPKAFSASVKMMIMGKILLVSFTYAWSNSAADLSGHRLSLLAV
jgi:hypothetical protein